MSNRSKADIKYAVDLLWTHQVRRENAILHKEIQHLREEVHSASNDVDAVRETSIAAQKSAEHSSSTVGKTEKVQYDLATTVNDAARRIEEVAHQSSLIEPKIVDIKRQGDWSIADLTSTVQQLDARVKASDEQQRRCLSPLTDEIANLRQKFATKAEASAVQALESKIVELQAERQRGKERQQSPGVVLDSAQEDTAQYGAGEST